MEGRRPRVDDGGVGVPPPTARLRFRPYREDDVENVFAMFSDAQARRFYPDMTDAAAARRWVERWIRHAADHGVSLWAVEDRASGAFVGDCGLVWQEVEGERVPEIGYRVTAARRGEGLATEAARACLAFGFAALPVDRIVSLVHVENAASRAVAERVHARLWKEIDRRGGRHRVYATTRKEFRLREAASEARGSARSLDRS